MKSALRVSKNDSSPWVLQATQQLLVTVQELSHARDLPGIAAIVREAARKLTGADGATFVLRENDQCYYLDESAIGPLWKGKRFPMQSCISGWVMYHATPAVIEDIYADPRIPADAYRPTFVRSLAMVPIRRDHPIGAIGNYWATPHMPTEEEVAILQALADTTSVALENAALYEELQRKLKALEDSNYELSRFAWVASHDLQEPLRTIVTQVEMLERHMQEQLDPQARQYVAMAVDGAGRLQNLIEDMLVHAEAEKSIHFRPVALEHVVQEACRDLQGVLTDSKARITRGELPWVWGDPMLLTRMMHNLISNALKFRRPYVTPHVHVSARQEGEEWIIAVQDNGIGIEPAYHQRVFGLFQRLHSQNVYPGSGIGLATCKKIAQLHGGRIWLESEPAQGTAIFCALPIKGFAANPTGGLA